MRENVDFRKTVRQFKQHLLDCFPFEESGKPGKPLSEEFWKIHTLVHNRIVMDDLDTLMGAESSPWDFFGVVNLGKMLRGNPRQIELQMDILVQTQTRDQECFERYSKTFSRLSNVSPSSVTCCKGENLCTELFIGPPRDHFKGRNSFPGIRLEGFKIKTKVSDLIDFCNKTSTFPAITELRFNSEALKPGDLIDHVLKCGFIDADHYIPSTKFFTFIESDREPKIKDERSVEDIIKEIEGTARETQKIKKRNKKPKKQEKSDISLKTELQISVNGPKTHNLKEQDDEACNSVGMHLKEREEFAKEKNKMESDLKNKRLLLKETKDGLEEKSQNVKNLLVKIDEAQSDNLFHQKKLNGLDFKIADLESVLEAIKREKAESEKKVEMNNERIAKLSDKKLRLDKYIDSEIQKRTEKAKVLEAEIALLEENIVRNVKESLKLEIGNKTKATAPTDPKKHLLNFLIEQKEKDLECPVCLVTATVPIYSCPESHLICSHCRPKVTECPECRVEYKDKQPTKRHRYAERMVEELAMLKRELIQIPS